MAVTEEHSMAVTEEHSMAVRAPSLYSSERVADFSSSDV